MTFTVRKILFVVGFLYSYSVVLGSGVPPRVPDRSFAHTQTPRLPSVGFRVDWKTRSPCDSSTTVQRKWHKRTTTTYERSGRRLRRVDKDESYKTETRGERGSTRKRVEFVTNPIWSVLVPVRNYGPDSLLPNPSTVSSLSRP